MIQAHHQVSGSSMGIHSLIRCGGMHLLSTYYEPASENRLLGHFHYLSARVTKVGNHNKVGRINQIRSSLKYVIYSPSVAGFLIRHQDCTGFPGRNNPLRAQRSQSKQSCGQPLLVVLNPPAHKPVFPLHHAIGVRIPQRSLPRGNSIRVHKNPGPRCCILSRDTNDKIGAKSSDNSVIGRVVLLCHTQTDLLQPVSSKEESLPLPISAVLRTHSTYGGDGLLKLHHLSAIPMHPEHQPLGQFHYPHRLIISVNSPNR